MNILIIDQKAENLYFSTPKGISKLSLALQSTSKILELKTTSKTGVKDVYGNIWFSENEKLFTILKNGHIINQDSLTFKSKAIIYNLMSDKLGNIIVGSDQGIIILKINKKGLIQSKKYF